MTDENPIIQEPVSAPRSGLPKEEVLARVRERLMNSGHPTVKEEYGTPLRGIETGLDEAFIVDRATYDALVKADPKSAAILKPFTIVEQINRWCVDPHEAWLIHTVPGTVNIDDYPAVRDHLARFRDRLEKRKGSGQWFELSQVAHVDPKDVSGLKIIFPDQVSWPGGYMLDGSGGYHAASGYYLRNGDYYIAGLLNSKVYWFLLNTMSPASAEGVMRVAPEHIEALPVPRTADLDLFAMVGGSSELCHKTLVEQRDFYDHVLSQIATHLAPSRKMEELSSMLRNWHMLTIESLQAEIKQLFGKVLTEEEATMWDHFLNEAQYEFGRINSDIARGERQIDLAICHMFNLTEEEIEHVLGRI